MEVAVKGVAKVGGGAGEGAHLSYHGEDSRKVVGGGWGEGDVEDGRGVYYCVDRCQVVYSWAMLAVRAKGWEMSRPWCLYRLTVLCPSLGYSREWRTILPIA